jgi:hypothetical protein
MPSPMLPSPLEAAEQVHVIGDGDLGFTSGLSFLDAERGIDVLVPAARQRHSDVGPALGAGETVFGTCGGDTRRGDRDVGVVGQCGFNHGAKSWVVETKPPVGRDLI